MKNYLNAVLFAVCAGVVSLQAQPGPQMLQGPGFGGANDKLFGDNQAFSAAMEMQTKDANGKTITMPGKFFFDSGKSRFEVDMAKVSGGKMRQDDAEQLKQMGMDNIVMIGRPDKKTSYLVYPGFQSYIENPLHDSQTAGSPDDYKADVTELGKETVDGHPCIKNKVVVTGKDGDKHESTVWNATDLKKFPVKIQTIEGGRDMTMLFKDVKTATPDPKSFNPPDDYKKYDSMMEMMHDQMMKRMGNGMSIPRY